MKNRSESMLKEQFLEAAMKVLSQAYETKEKLKEKLASEEVQGYIKGIKDLALNILENSSQSYQKPTKTPAPEAREEKPKPSVSKKVAKAPVKTPAKSPAKTTPKPKLDLAKKPAAKTKVKVKPEAKAPAKKAAAAVPSKAKASESPALILAPKKERKSSIKPAKEIDSTKAEKIVKWLKADSARKLRKNEELNGNKSLACLIWALGHAERANVREGISVHDVTALLFKISKINLYPINISRVVHMNTDLVHQVGQQKRTKTYLLTKEGQAIFSSKFM